MKYRNWAIAVTIWGLAGAAAAIGGETPVDLLGTPVPASATERRIEIGPATRWANVTQGEAILFVLGTQSFGWKFNGPPRSFDLRRVAPAGALDRPLTVYVAHKAEPARN